MELPLENKKIIYRKLDCTSAFVVDSEKIFVTCSLITMQNLVIIIM